ncbi:MAG: F-type H+-transporting ATPase subunit gamma [Crocinitomix sp.]|jgi:F-type H+-transporting ATPase subunit gamma
MANLKEIRNRITSVSSTMQITSAMKMVSAAKLKRAQDAVTKMMPYSQKLQEILSSLSSSLDTSDNIYASDREVKNVVLVPITSNRGLCGGFNNYITKETLRLANEEYKGLNVSVVPIGKKATDAFKKTSFISKADFLPSDLNEIWNELTYANATPIAEKLMSAYANKEVDKVVIIYNHSKNVATQIVTAAQLLPVVQDEVETAQVELDYIFEPSQEEIVAELLPKTLKTQLYSILLESYAGEHGARMTAMHKATDNASDLNKALKLEYNKARQAAITNEILEIVGGAEALNG